MPDVLGYHAKLGVLGPSTNTIVEPDYYMMAPPGVTLHYSRIYIPDGRLNSDDEFVRLMEQIRANLDQAIVEVMTAEPSRSCRAGASRPARPPATGRCSSLACGGSA